MSQRGNLAGREVPPGSRRQAGQAHVANADADQAGDRVAERSHHPAHLPVAAFVNGQLHFPLPGSVRVLLAAQQADVLSGLGHAVVEHDAAPQAPQRIVAGNAGHRNPVGFGDMVARVGHLKQKVAVIRQKDQAFAVGIQAPDGTQHRLSADVY